MIAANTISGNRQELHATARSAAEAAKLWKARGYKATIQWANGLEDTLCIVIVTE